MPSRRRACPKAKGARTANDVFNVVLFFLPHTSIIGPNYIGLLSLFLQFTTTTDFFHDHSSHDRVMFNFSLQIAVNAQVPQLNQYATA
jgi:hypothetical protein